MALGVKFVWRSLLAILLLGLAPSISSQAAAFGCAPTTVTPDSTLVMTLPWPHDGLLDIETPPPEGAFYDVIDSDEPKWVGFKPMISTPKFKRMKTLSLKIRDIKGDNFGPDVMWKTRRKPTRVFTVSGTYTLHVVAIRTDQGFPIHEGTVLCEVNYVDPSYTGPRPKRRFFSDIVLHAE